MRNSKLTTIMDELCLFSSKASKDLVTLREVNDILSDSIGSVGRVGGRTSSDVLDELLKQASNYGLVRERQDLNLDNTNLQLSKNFA
jgi:hypothetical protein